MKKLLYRINETADLISKSQSSVYNLLDTGDLEGHNVCPGRKGLRITAISIETYVKKYLLAQPTE